MLLHDIFLVSTLSDVDMAQIREDIGCIERDECEPRSSSDLNNTEVMVAKVEDKCTQVSLADWKEQMPGVHINKPTTSVKSINVSLQRNTE